MKTKFIYIAFLLLITTGGCSGKMDKVPRNFDYTVREISDDAVTALCDKKIFFGHASVGFNIMGGVENIVANDERFQKLNIRLVKIDENIKGCGIYHAVNGKNGLPKSKINGFKEILSLNGKGDDLDIALFKFCYVDIHKKTDIHDIFEYYVETIESIKMEFPNLTIVHVTTPLYAHGKGIKGFIKNLVYGDVSNVMRNQFNTLLINKYQYVDPIYDLAKIESLYPNGKRSSFRYKSNKYYSLAKGYTYDGGHLNEIGSYLAAKGLLKILSDIDVNKRSLSNISSDK